MRSTLTQIATALLLLVVVLFGWRHMAIAQAVNRAEAAGAGDG